MNTQFEVCVPPNLKGGYLIVAHLVNGQELLINAITQDKDEEPGKALEIAEADARHIMKEAYKKKYVFAGSAVHEYRAEDNCYVQWRYLASKAVLYVDVLFVSDPETFVRLAWGERNKRNMISNES